MTQHFRLLILAVLASSIAYVHADSTGGELDDSTSGAPAALIVQEDAQGGLVAFKSTDGSTVSDDLAAQSALAATISESNQIAHVAVLGELDQTSSTETWFRWYHPDFFSGGGSCIVGDYFAWTFGYNLSGIAYHYVSYYAYRWGGYVYHFFHRH